MVRLRCSIRHWLNYLIGKKKKFANIMCVKKLVPSKGNGWWE